MAQRQQSFSVTKTSDKFSYGGSLRNFALGRSARPLSSKHPLHLVFKINQGMVKSGLRGFQSQKIIRALLQRYSQKFFIRVEHISIQKDHIHMLIRSSRRKNAQSFFRVLAGQIAQVFEKENLLKSVGPMTDTPKSGRGGWIGGVKKLWKHRPFSRVVLGRRALGIARDYLMLNELEALGIIPYQVKRLRGLNRQQRLKLRRVRKNHPELLC